MINNVSTIIDASNTIRVEYMAGANVVICSITGDTIPNDYISYIEVEYSYIDPTTLTLDSSTVYNDSYVALHVLTSMMYIKDLPSDTSVTFTPYIYEYVDDNYTLMYKWQLCDPITVKTLPYGNITCNILKDNGGAVAEKMQWVCKYLNEMGCYSTNTKAKTIPVLYNLNVQTASAYYYNHAVDAGDYGTQYGLVQTSGGTYASLNTLFHELRHRYGICTRSETTIERIENEIFTSCFGPIKPIYTAIHNALKFESGDPNAVVWIADAHSNCLENFYYSVSDDSLDYDPNYLAAAMIKALIYYIDHTTSEADTSKSRFVVLPNVRIVEVIDEE